MTYPYDPMPMGGSDSNYISDIYCHRCKWKGKKNQLAKLYIPSHTDPTDIALDELVCPSCLTSDELEMEQP